MEGPPKGFAAGRAHLESLSFGMNEQRAARPMGGGGGREGEGADDQESGSHMPRGGGHLGGTMKLFASLGLSPSDLDVLAQIPEEDISVETLPQILLQLKNRKAGRGPSSGWDDGGRMGGGGGGGGASFSQASGSSDFGFASASRAAGLNFGGGRERSYGELSHRDSYGGPQGASLSQAAFPQRRKGSPSLGKVQDFLGAPPPRFPHVCSLCDFDVHSNMVSKATPPSHRHLRVTRDPLCRPSSMLVFFPVKDAFPFDLAHVTIKDTFGCTQTHTGGGGGGGALEFG